MIFTTTSSKETKALGQSFAKKISAHSRKSALVLALDGELGAGKTTFLQGFLKTFGATRIKSPTFILMRRSKTSHPQFKNAYHLDAYRLKSSSDLDVLGWDKIISDPQNVVVVEWADRIKSALPRTAAKIKFKHGAQKNERKIILPTINPK